RCRSRAGDAPPRRTSRRSSPCSSSASPWCRCCSASPRSAPPNRHWTSPTRSPSPPASPQRSPPRLRSPAACTAWCCWTSSRTPPSPSCACSPTSSAPATPPAPSATRSRRSTAGAAPRPPPPTPPPRRLPPPRGPGPPARAVGDPQQAIYGCRGASAASLAGFADAFATEEQPVLQRTLSTSWRNDEAVLAVANRLAGPLRSAGAGIEIPELHPRPGAGEGACEILEAADERAEARAIADWILARRAEDGRDAGDGAGPADAPPASAAVLVRARRQIPALVAGLEERGLPAQVVGLGGLLHRPEVADVRALLECAHDPGRGDALMRLLTGPRIRLGARDLAVLGRWRERMGSRRRAGAGEAGAVGARDEAEEVSLVD